MKMWLFGLVFLQFVSACETSQVVAIKADRIATVQQKLKENLAAFYLHKTKLETPLDTQVACGIGALDYEISSVQVKLTTTFDTQVTGPDSLSRKESPIKVISVSLSSGYQRTNTQILTYTQWPAPSGYYLDTLSATELLKSAADSNWMASYPIADALINLRDGLIKSSREKPCFLSVDPSAKAGVTSAGPNTDSTASGASGAKSSNSFQIGLAVDYKAGVGLTLGLGPLSLGSTTATSLINDNTITVTFVPVPHSLPDGPWDICQRASPTGGMRMYWCLPKKTGEQLTKDAQRPKSADSTQEKLDLEKYQGYLNEIVITRDDETSPKH